MSGFWEQRCCLEREQYLIETRKTLDQMKEYLVLVFAPNEIKLAYILVTIIKFVFGTSMEQIIKNVSLANYMAWNLGQIFM